jgi:nicotinamide mononucleotide transporter
VIDALLRELHAIGPVEALGVALGYLYVLLIYRRSRLGWLAGGASSIAFMYLFARARLPMQSSLQVYYVVMSIYGWRNWTRSEQQEAGGISLWPLRYHAVAVFAIVAASALLAALLRRETHAALPFLDSMTTCASVFATWLLARLKLENWLYWMWADSLTAYMLAAQGLLPSAGMYFSYLVIAVFGFRSWLRRYRHQSV